MVVNLWNTNSSNLSEQLLLGNQTQQAPTSTETQLREQLCAIQSNIQQLSPLNHHQLASSGSVSSPRSAFTSPDPSVTPLNTYGTQPTSTSLLLAAQLLFGTQAENTPPQLVSSLNSNLLSPGAHQQLLMDTSHINGTLQSTGSGDAGSPSSSNSNDINGDAEGAEGVWSADIDQAFHEALQIYPPCGRRKIILSEEGKMYGRNELIARYIKIRCGKTRTRKQVSSHIQVLARKKNREAQSKVKTHDSIKPEPHGSNFGSPKSADSLGHQPQISPSANALTNPLFKQQIKVESLTKAVDSLANVGVVPTQPQQTLAAGLQWPYNLPGMLNNNFYGNVGLNNDENLYANFAAALNAQQQIQSFGVQVPSTANASLLSLGGLPALNKILPNLSLPGNSLLTGAASLIADTPSAHIIGSSKLTLHGFTAYMERENQRAEIVKIPAIIDEPLESIRFESIQSKFPEELGDLFRSGPSDAFFLIKCWANLNFDVNLADNENDLYAVDSLYESPHNFEITISSKVCSFGKQVVEKVEVYTANDDEQKSQTSSASSFPPFNYKLEKSPMCEYMVAFIRELKKLENSEMNNCVLENFTILQVIQNKQNDETLMTLAFMFEVSPEPESNCRIYRIVP